MIFNIDDRFEIRPFSNQLCYEIFEHRVVVNKKTKEPRETWVSSGKYPSTLGGALRTVHEMMMLTEEGSVRGLDATRKYVDSVADRVLGAVKEG